MASQGQLHEIPYFSGLPPAVEMDTRMHLYFDSTWRVLHKRRHVLLSVFNEAEVSSGPASFLKAEQPAVRSLRGD